VPGRNTESQIIDLFKDIYDNLDNKNCLCVYILFVDFTDAFTSIPHEELLNDLYKIGVDGEFFDIINDNYQICKQYVSYKEIKSDLYDVNSGVLQGGVLSPQIFNIYVREMQNNLKYCKPYQFADDSALLIPIYNLDDSDNFQHDINNFVIWCEKRKLNINALKTKLIRFTKKLNINHIDYYINNLKIEMVSSHKHLGIYLDDKLTFNEHFDYVIAKSIKKWSTLKHICNTANGEIFKKLYKTYILPILEYCNLILLPNQTQNKRLEMFQRKATKYICYKYGKTDLNYKERLKLLNMSTLEKRRKTKALLLLYKIRHKFVNIPKSWENLFSFKMMRNGLNIEPIFNRLYLTDKHVFYSLPKLFNSLPIEIRNSIDTKKFTENVKNFL
jgi:hypothetical protein